MDPFVGEIRIFPFNFAPKGWAFCDGKPLLISQNTVLFSLLGTMYGGDGKKDFGLPNLQGAVPLFFGQGPGLSQYYLGETSGSETVTLLASELPAHSHAVQGDSQLATSADPTGNLPAQVPSRNPRFPSKLYSGVVPNVTTAAFAVSSGDQPHNNRQPYLVLNFCIALQGVYPTRG